MLLVPAIVCAHVTDPISNVVEGIAAEGYAIVANALPPAAVTALRERALALDARGELAPAAVGRASSRTTRPDIRGDCIRWLDPGHPAAAERALWGLLDALRDAANRSLMLGLWSFEGHYALYPAGASYARHRDRFRDDDARMLSCILYLNDDWQSKDGGALRLYVSERETRDVLPAGGTLVVFLADRFEHEVLPATRPRLAMTGWFRRRAP
jgi:SM-20-related protein